MEYNWRNERAHKGRHPLRPHRHQDMNCSALSHSSFYNTVKGQCQVLLVPGLSAMSSSHHGGLSVWYCGHSDMSNPNTSQAQWPYPGNPIASEVKQEGQEFKVFSGYTEFKASLCHMRSHAMMRGHDTMSQWILLKFLPWGGDSNNTCSLLPRS